MACAPAAQVRVDGGGAAADAGTIAGGADAGAADDSPQLDCDALCAIASIVSDPDGGVSVGATAWTAAASSATLNGTPMQKPWCLFDQLDARSQLDSLVTRTQRIFVAQ